MTESTPYDLDCVVAGHRDGGFAAHEEMLRLRGVRSGDYRNLRMDFITLDGRKLPYLEAFNHLAGQLWHWTELPQVAPYYLASFLTRHGLRARAAGFYPGKRADLERAVERSGVVALTTTLYLSPLAARAAVADVRAINPGATVVVGGPLVDNLHFHLGESDLAMILSDIGADVYVLERLGERTLTDLVTALRDGGGMDGVKNCYLPGPSGWRFTGAEPEVVPPDEAYIDWRLFDAAELGPTAQTRTARSCAFACSFCDYPVRAGPLALAGIETVERELHQLRDLGVRNVVFIDDTFNVPAGRFKELCRMMIRNRFDFRWYSYFRCANARDEETFDLMRESGCEAVFLGIEAGDDGILANMHKAATLDRYRYGMEQLHRRGITTFASFIVGFPGETDATVGRMIDFINETRPTFYRGEIWYYNHRSPIHREQERFALQGTGYRWRHATMDWSEACDQVERLFGGVTGSTWLPMYDLDFWILPYLAGKGISAAPLRDFVARCNRLLAMELNPERFGPEERDRVEQELRVCATTLAGGAPAAPVRVGRIG
jgi:radical SAM PhpK family P-methyltransferase